MALTSRLTSLWLTTTLPVLSGGTGREETSLYWGTALVPSRLSRIFILEVGSITVYGKSEMGILGLYAGLPDSRIGQVVLQDPPGSHTDGPALLNILRLTDIPDVARAFAPRKLIFVGKVPAAFAPNRDSSAAGSLPEALEVWKY
jgi:hypothetical protein